jgi:hypothetical protein
VSGYVNGASALTYTSPTNYLGTYTQQGIHALSSGVNNVMSFSNFNAITNYCEFGSDAVAAGDVNGDGIDDVIFTAYDCLYMPGSWPDVGATFIIDGKNTWNNSIVSVDALNGSNGVRIESSSSYAGVGTNSPIVDTLDDSGKKGFAYVGGPFNMKTVFNTTSWAASPATGYTLVDNFNGITGMAFDFTSDNATGSVSLATGDMTGDGIHDVLIGVGTDGVGLAGANSGSAYLIYGAKAGTLPGSITNASANQGVYFTRFDGATAGDQAGQAEQSFDLDKDGTSDIIIGAPAASPSGISNAGSVYVLCGKSGWKGTATYSLGNIQ